MTGAGHDELVDILQSSWDLVLADYKSGIIEIKDEYALQKILAQRCLLVANQMRSKITVTRESEFGGRRVDVVLSSPVGARIYLQLKLYHDDADWSASQTMDNTFESDCIFAKGRLEVFVGVIDVIPNRRRRMLDFNLTWKEFVLSDRAFQLANASRTVKPRLSVPLRERIQRAALMRGADLAM